MPREAEPGEQLGAANELLALVGMRTGGMEWKGGAFHETQTSAALKPSRSVGRLAEVWLACDNALDDAPLQAPDALNFESFAGQIVKRVSEEVIGL